MSGLAGLFKFDPRDRVSNSELMDLARGIDRVGPDGGAEHVEGNIGMAFRALHTTIESKLETQPLIREDTVLVWDGRLDNRDDISSRVRRTFAGLATDLDLVHAAYAKWGTGCFSELLGDWALALWDRRKQTLFLARDCFGIRTLFYTLESRRLIWCSAIEPLVLGGNRTLSLDNEYLAGCLYPYPPLGTTPYREIKVIQPAHFHSFQYGGKNELTRYWALNPHSKIRYSQDRDYEKHFLDLFRHSVRQRIRSDRPVLAELSGGLDSSSIVCMADDVRRTESGPAVETLSYYDTEEPGGDERLYFEAIELHRAKVGHHVSMADFRSRTQHDSFSPVPGTYLPASPGHFAPSIEWARTIEGIQQTAKSRVILSGLGGDELLGGVQYEAVEPLEHLLSGNLAAFTKSVARWSITARKPVTNVAKNILTLATARYMLDSFVRTPANIPWILVHTPLRDFALKSFSSWRALSPNHLFSESIRYVLASQLSCVDVPAIGISEKRYPYLDRSLYSFLASIPRTQIIQADRRRHLMRRALRHLVPDQVLFRKTKWFGRRIFSARIRDHHEVLERMVDGGWVSDGVLFDVTILRERLRAVQHGLVPEARLVLIALSIEQWVRRQIALGIIPPLQDVKTARLNPEESPSG